MSVEIERKFLVEGDFKDIAHASHEIVQGYLSSVPERSVRIRIMDEQAFITVKGISNELGLSRFEWEKEIPKGEAKELMKLCEPGVIHKVRYLVANDKHTIEVDEFFGENEGLIMAEVELESETEAFEKPHWLGEEVTGLEKYYNAYLSHKPYSTW